MRIALAQLNPIVGDLAGNTTLVLDAVATARRDGAEVVVCPELAVLGYPPRDLLLRDGVVEGCEAAVRLIAEHARGLTVIVGHPRRVPGGLRGVRNSVSVCRDGVVVAVHDKRLLPGYDVFDEDRYFDAGEAVCVVDSPGGRLGILNCEDLWQAGDVVAEPRYAMDPLRDLLDAGAEIIVSVNASPFIVGKLERHLARSRAVAREHGVPVVAVNQVGANDDLIFDGRSFVIDASGTIRTQLPGWTPVIRTVDLAEPTSTDHPTDHTSTDHTPEDVSPIEDVFHALVLGVHDYGWKTGHDRLLVGLSGGIDSAVTATIAAAAVGAANVTGVMMPSRYSSVGSVTDARLLAEALGLGTLEEIPIEDAHAALQTSLATGAGIESTGAADENVQARLRGLLLMARANATGALVLATGNKSEMAVGYTTLYGDMCGAIAVLGDVVKGRVYELGHWINAHHAAVGFAHAPIPEGSLTKPPSAELRPGQTDQDTLPPYDVLDAIIERSVELEHEPERIIADTEIDPDTVRDTIRMIDHAEHKREQAAIVLKITHRTFGRGRPMPVVMRQTPAPTSVETPSSEVLTPDS